jgi:hypothetical protein
VRNTARAGRLWDHLGTGGPPSEHSARRQRPRSIAEPGENSAGSS